MHFESLSKPLLLEQELTQRTITVDQVADLVHHKVVSRHSLSFLKREDSTLQAGILPGQSLSNIRHVPSEIDVPMSPMSQTLNLRHFSRQTMTYMENYKHWFAPAANLQLGAIWDNPQSTKCDEEANTESSISDAQNTAIPIVSNVPKAESGTTNM